MLRSTAVGSCGTTGNRLDIGVAELEADAAFAGCYHLAAFDGCKIDLVAGMGNLCRLAALAGGGVERVAHGCLLFAAAGELVYYICVQCNAEGLVAG